MIILYSMVMIQLPALIEKILFELSAVGIHPSLTHQYAPSTLRCIVQDPDRMAMALAVFFSQLETVLQGSPCTLQWNYREGALTATLKGDFPPTSSMVARIRTSLRCIGGTLTVEKEGYLLTLPIDPSQPSYTPSPKKPTGSPEVSAIGSSKDETGQLSEAPPLDGQNSIFDSSVLQQACPDGEFSQQIMEGFLSHCRTLLLELEHLISHGEDLVKIHRIAHSIKGGGLNVGAFRLAEVARWMEQKARGGRWEGLEKALELLKEEESLLESAYRKHYGREANPSSGG